MLDRICCVLLVISVASLCLAIAFGLVMGFVEGFGTPVVGWKHAVIATLTMIPAMSCLLVAPVAVYRVWKKGGDDA